MNRGYTIVELIIVVTVLAILISISAVGMSAYQRQANDSERRADIAVIDSQLEKFYADSRYYPEQSETTGTTAPISIASFYQNSLQKSVLDPQDKLTMPEGSTGQKRIGNSPFCFNTFRDESSGGAPTGCRGYLYQSGTGSCSGVCSSSQYKAVSYTCRVQATVSSTAAGGTVSGDWYILAYYSAEDNRMHILKRTKGAVTLTLLNDAGGSASPYPTQTCAFDVT